MAENDPITVDDATDRLDTLIRNLLHATIEHNCDDALTLIRRYTDRALPGTTNVELDAALKRIIDASLTTRQ